MILECLARLRITRRSFRAEPPTAGRAGLSEWLDEPAYDIKEESSQEKVSAATRYGSNVDPHPKRGELSS